MGKKSKRQRTRKKGGAAHAPAAALAPAPEIHEERCYCYSCFETRQGKLPEGMTPQMEADHMQAKFLELKKQIVTEEDKWNPDIYRAFHHYSESIISASKQPGVNFHLLFLHDRKFLKEVSNTSTELIHIRTIATITWGIVCFLQCDFEDSAQCYIRAIELCQQATESEKKKAYVTTDGPISMEEILVSLEKHVQEKLDMGRSLWVAPKTTDEAPFPLYGCIQCDVCGKTYKELGVAMLDCCSVCQMTYYCSRECQCVGWKDHKKVCRKRGEFRIGDKAFKLVDTTEFDSGQFTGRILVTIMDVNGDNVLVADEESQTTGHVHRDYLRRARPTVWMLGGKGFQLMKAE